MTGVSTTSSATTAGTTGLTPALTPARAAAFGLTYAVLTVIGRLTAIEGQVVSLVWPGAGVAVLWLLAESPRHLVRVLVPLTAIHGVVVVLTGVEPVLGLFGALSVTIQTALVGLLLRRWCPTMLGAGGTASIRSPRTLLLAAAATAVGCLTGALLGTAGLWVIGEQPGPLTTLAWFARHVSGIVTVGAVGHLAWEWYTQAIPSRTHGGSRAELGVLWLVSVAATVAVFDQPYPLTFLLIGFAVWSAARFRTFPSALHCLVLGAIALTLSLTGHGPFDRIGDPVMEVLVSQAFMVGILVTGLSVGALGDRVDELYATATRAREEAAEQAELLAEMTESMDEGLVVLGPDGRVERSNGASRRLAHRVRPGVADAEALADLVDLLLHPDLAHTGAARAELGVGDVVVPLRSGEEVVIAVSRTPLARSGGRRGVLLVLGEVTEHRSGLRPLAGFASTAAHDLRGPLSAIQSWLSLAVDDLEPDSEALMPLRRAERAAEQMGDLIEDLLQHALAESGELRATDVRLGGPDGVLTQVAGPARPGRRAGRLPGPPVGPRRPGGGAPALRQPHRQRREVRRAR